MICSVFAGGTVFLLAPLLFDVSFLGHFVDQLRRGSLRKTIFERLELAGLLALVSGMRLERRSSDRRRPSKGRRQSVRVYAFS
jgi:hypothetical protein